MLREDDIEKKVILLKLLLREEDESVEDALKALADTKMATLDELKKLLEELKKDGLVSKDGNLTVVGESEAKKAKQEFTL